MIRLAFICLFPSLISYSQSANLSIDGYYQGMNLYVSNPYQSDGFGFCVSKVLVNGNILPATIQNEHFQIDLSLFGLAKGEELFVELEHYEGCTPRFVNPEILLPKSTFSIVSLSATSNGSINWSTQNENGRLPFHIEQFKWGRWISVGEIQGNGKPTINKYLLTIIPHSGYNKVRIMQLDNTGQKRISKEVGFTSSVKKVIKTPAKVKDFIYFSSDGVPVKTKYELYDAFANILIKGYGSQVNCKNLLNGIYFINFDNSSEKFIKY